MASAGCWCCFISIAKVLSSHLVRSLFWFLQKKAFFVFSKLHSIHSVQSTHQKSMGKIVVLGVWHGPQLPKALHSHGAHEHKDALRFERLQLPGVLYTGSPVYVEVIMLHQLQKHQKLSSNITLMGFDFVGTSYKCIHDNYTGTLVIVEVIMPNQLQICDKIPIIPFYELWKGFQLWWQWSFHTVF